MREVIFDGYLAELITLRAEREGLTAEQYVVNIFLRNGCNAPAES